MTDRELLEFTAKVAGYDQLTEWCEQITDYDSPHYMQWALHEKGPGGQCKSWNPLLDDGDAFRLLASSPYLDSKWWVTEAWQHSDTEEGRRAYLRRRIVTAIAEFKK